MEPTEPSRRPPAHAVVPPLRSATPARPPLSPQSSASQRPLHPLPSVAPRAPLHGGIEIAPGVRVPEEALRFSFARSSGPGGQNVNKVSTKAVLRIRVADLPVGADVRSRLLAAAGHRLVGAEGQEELLLSSDSERSQEANKDWTLTELRRMLVTALIRPKKRRATKPSRGAKMRRLESKKRRGEIKRQRRGEA